MPNGHSEEDPDIDGGLDDLEELEGMVAPTRARTSPRGDADREASGSTGPRVAFARCLVTAVVMAVGASLGDVLPE